MRRPVLALGPTVGSYACPPARHLGMHWHTLLKGTGLGLRVKRRTVLGSGPPVEPYQRRAKLYYPPLPPPAQAPGGDSASVQASPCGRRAAWSAVFCGARAMFIFAPPPPLHLPCTGFRAGWGAHRKVHRLQMKRPPCPCPAVRYIRSFPEALPGLHSSCLFLFLPLTPQALYSGASTVLYMGNEPMKGFAKSLDVWCLKGAPCAVRKGGRTPEVRGGGTGGTGGRYGGVRGGGGMGGYGGEVRGGVRWVHTQGGAHKRRPVATARVLLCKGPRARRYTQKAAHTQGGAHKRRPVANAGVLLFKGPRARRYTQKAVHTQGGAHKRRSVATARVLLFKGPQARRYTQKAAHTQGGAHKRWPVATAGVLLFKGPRARRYTQKAVHTQGGAHKRRPVATAGVLLFKGPRARRYTQKAAHTQGGAHKRRPVANAGVLLFKGPRARRYTQKAVHTQGGEHKRRSVVTAGVLLFKGPQARRYTQKAVHTEDGAHTTHCTQHAVCSHRRSLVI